jgi:ABC-2 type transport system ATP-binding protein
MNVVEIQSLTKRFGELTAVDALTLGVESGEIFGLLGPNGAGKSTAIKMLTTLLPPTGGTATVAGHGRREHPRKVRASIGYVPQLLSADGTLTGHENLLLFAKLYDIPRRQRAIRISEAIEAAGLHDAASRLVRNYSGGMIRRLEVAMALLHRPHVLFLDEPTVGLDPLARHAVWRQVQSLVAEHGTSVLITTHLMDEADLLCNRIAIMNFGKVAAIGSPRELKASLGAADATLDDVFAHFAGGALEHEGGQYRDVAQTRQTAARVG